MMKGCFQLSEIQYMHQNNWANDWLLFNAMWATFQLYYGKTNLHFNEMMIKSALY